MLFERAVARRRASSRAASAIAVEIDGADRVLIRELREHGAHDFAYVSLVVAEIIEQRFQGGVSDLQLGRIQLQSVRRFSGLDEVWVVVHMGQLYAATGMGASRRRPGAARSDRTPHSQSL